ncbi:DUF421 domain-containing protein [Neobacillus mesonae]|uniref:DUF421 domain-containing protein n=1 Tax=Neobacillus mesonae TaxID=1193713 RepID=UPI002574127F|nr:DUF421 domain-containing protein [Neobacillus mesonae]
MYGMIALKLIIGLITLVVIVRLIGKKELAQITPLDFVYAVILGGILEESIFDDKVTVGHFIFALAIWALAIFLFERIMQRFEKFRVLIMGEPCLVIRDGELDVKAFEKSKLEPEQLRTLLRQQGIFSLKEVKYAYLETSGNLSVMKYPEFDPVTPAQLKVEADSNEPSILLVDEGRIEEKGLRMIDKDEDWLRESLKKEGYGSIEEIYCAEWTEREGFFIQKYI